MDLTREHPHMWVCAAAIAAVLSAAGCVSTSPPSAPAEAYPAQSELPSIEQITTELEEQDTYLSLAETGRLKMLEGRFADSRSDFERLIDYLIEFEEGPIIRLSGVHDELVAGALVDDRSRDYHLPGYEAVMAFQHQALNRIFDGDLQGAWVELRRAFYAQYFIARDYREKLDAVMADLDESRYRKSLEKMRESMTAMDQVLAGGGSSFSNPYIWFLCGLMFEAQGDANSALQSYREALSVHPSNPHLQRDVRRLARRLGAPLPEGVEWTDEGAADGETELIVVLEEGVVSPRRSAKSFVFVGTFQPVVIPVYDDPPYRPVSAVVEINGEAAGSLSLLSSIQALAYHDLSEKMPGIIARNTTRTASRAVTQTALRVADPVGLRAAGAVYHAATAVGDQADTRAWSTLPMAVQMARIPVRSGRQAVRVLNEATGAGISMDVDVKPGERALIWIHGVQGGTHAFVASLSRPGQVTRHRSTRSMVGAPRFAAPVGMPAGQSKGRAQEMKVDRVDQFMQGSPIE